MNCDNLISSRFNLPIFDMFFTVESVASAHEGNPFELLLCSVAPPFAGDTVPLSPKSLSDSQSEVTVTLTPK